MAEEIHLTINRRTNCERAWIDAMEHCKEVVGEDDFELISGFGTVEEAMGTVKDLEAKYSRGATARMLTSIKPGLTQLQTFSTAIFVGLGANNISAACLWGAASLLIQVRGPILSRQIAPLFVRHKH